MTKKIICENDNLKENLKELEKMGYTLIVTAKDNFLTGWGKGAGNGHIQLIACRTMQELNTIVADLKADKTMSYIDYQIINNYKAISNYIRNKSFTIRNDWTRCFKNEVN